MVVVILIRCQPEDCPFPLPEQAQPSRSVETEEFVAKKIGHDAARTRYEVDRSPRNSMAREAAAYEPPQRSTPTAQASAVSM